MQPNSRPLRCDEALAGVLAGIETASPGLLARVGATRTRGGLVRGMSWGEVSGRGPDGAWYELRVSHEPRGMLLRAGLLAYQPLARGGRTLVLGEASYTYANGPAEVVPRLVGEIVGWLVQAAGAAA